MQAAHQFSAHAATAVPLPRSRKGLGKQVVGRRPVSHICRVDDPAQQQMREAEKRWERSLAEGRIQNVSDNEVAEYIKNGWKILDVRPPHEVAKAPIKSAVEVPIFIADPDWDPIALLKKFSNWSMGGWWVGGTHTIPNDKFVEQVGAKLSREDNIIVGCQKGLRSLAASEQLSRAGFPNLAWINGGFDTVKDSLETTNGADVRYGGIGGMSELLGWTDVQRDEGKRQGFSAKNFLKLGLTLLALDIIAIAA